MACAAVHGMLPRHIGALVAAGDVRLAPDGSSVAFTRQTIELDENRYRTAVWLAPVDGAASPREVGDPALNRSLARWSPDGTRLAFVARSLDEEATGCDLQIVDLSSSASTVVCRAREPITELEWSPDGGSLAFVARDPDPAVYGTDGTPAKARKERDTPARRITTFFTRLDNEGWICDRPARVFRVAAAPDATPVALTPGPFQAEHLAWSPDASTIVFASGRHPTWDLDLAVDLYAVAADGTSAPACITGTRGAYKRPAYTVDGATVIALWDPDPRNAPHHARLVRIEPNNEDQHEILPALDRNAAPFPGERAPIPRPHGDVLFSYEDGGAVVLAGADDRGRHTPVVDGARWVTSFDARDDVIAYAAADATHPADVWVSDDRGTRRLTDHVAELHAAGALPVAMERFAATSTGGVEVECWALRPEGDGPFPTLVNIHGGPFGQYGYKLFDEFQLQVGAGFGVICCNPRGSSGYSEAWARAIRWPNCEVDPGTGWGAADYDDVMACVDAALARFDWIDGDRLGVLGGSYGGYLTSWIVGHTDRFKAACSERSVNNLLTEEHNSDIASAFSDTVGVSHLDDPDAYLSRSPITFIRDMRTPLLILHSEDDLRCPISQAEELFVGLRLLGRTPELWRFPGEGHELSRSGAPAHRVQRAEIILEFFGRHLQASWPKR
ncbi:MAG: S9 family peptidase [Actinobacteria bacterium]|nr:S9 family peptidase [Actinomycetota bacterium]